MIASPGSVPVSPGAPSDHMRPALLLLVIVVAAAVAAGCGSTSTSTPDRTLRIYVSEPVRGGRGGDDTIRAVRIAVDHAQDTIQGANLQVVARNDAGPSGQFAPQLVRRNATEAANDDTSVAYVGDFDSGATQLGMPILNRAGILQVGSGATAVSLTHPPPAERRIIVPTGVRTYGRVVPNDTIQSAALGQFMQEESVDRAYVVDDRGTYGKGLAAGFTTVAPQDGIHVVGHEIVDAGTDLPALARRVQRSGAQAILIAASDLSRARAVMEAVHHEDVHVKLFGGDALTPTRFLRSLGDMGLDTYLTAPVLPPGNYARSARVFTAAFREQYHRAPNPTAIFGYEAGRAVVASLRVATGGVVRGQSIAALRRGTRDAFFAIRERASALGSYSIDRFGDTTLAFYGAYRVFRGELALGRSLSIPPSQLNGTVG